MDFKELLTYLKGSFDPQTLFSLAIFVFFFTWFKKFVIWLYKIFNFGSDLHEKIQDIEPLKQEILNLKKDQEEIKSNQKIIYTKVENIEKNQETMKEFIRHKFDGIKNLLRKNNENT